MAQHHRRRAQSSRAEGAASAALQVAMLVLLSFTWAGRSDIEARAEQQPGKQEQDMVSGHGFGADSEWMSRHAARQYSRRPRRKYEHPVVAISNSCITIIPAASFASSQ